MGHEQVSVLDGGFPAWMLNGFPTVDNLSDKQQTGDFNAIYKPRLISKITDIEDALRSNGFKLIDARSEGRFHGTEPEPRAGLRSGHMPNAVNIPFNSVLDGIYMKTRAELADQFKGHLLEDKELIFSCGSGVTACIVALAAELVGLKKISVYDGSWSEWGSISSLPISEE